jgi:hypothetical protein
MMECRSGDTDSYILDPRVVPMCSMHSIIVGIAAKSLYLEYKHNKMV